MFRILKNLTMKSVIIIFFALLLIIFQVWLDLKIPDYMREITTVIQTEGSSIQDVLKPGGNMLLCAGASLVTAIIVGYMIAYVSSCLSMDVREKVYSKVENFSLLETKKFTTGSLITRTTNDITQIEVIISVGLQLAIRAPIMAIWALFKIMGKGWEWTALTGGSVLLLVAMIIIAFILVIKKFKLIQKLIDKINNIVRENLTGIRVVRAFNAEKYQEEKFDKTNEELTGISLYTSIVLSIMSPGIYLILDVLPLGIYYIGAMLINNAGFEDKIALFSDMVVFSSYAMQIIMSFLMLAIAFIMYPRANVSAKRIMEVLDTESKIKDGSFDKETEIKGCIEFKNVCFRYPDADKNVLENISFKVNKGETFAFIGSTGSR